MHNFLFKCPALGLMVQGSLDRSVLPPEGSFAAYQCPGCGRVHLVDPRKQAMDESSSSSASSGEKPG